MFLEINDISTGTVVQETLNALSIDFVYKMEVNSKYRLIYKLNNGLVKVEEFDSSSDLEEKLDEVKEMSIGGGASTNVYTYKGSCEFDELPTSGQVAGDVWNIEDAFDLDGKHYPAGTNVAWDGTGWDALSGSVDLSAYASKEYLVEDNYLRFVDVKYADSYPKESIDLSAITKTGIYFLNGYNNGASHNYPQAIKLRGITNVTTSQPTNCQGIGILYLYKTYANAANNEYFARMYGTGWDSTGLRNIVCEIKKTNSSGTGIIVDTTPDYNYIIRGTTLTSDSQTISGTKTFNSLPVSSGTPTQNTQLVNKQYVDSQSVTFKAFPNTFPTTGTTQDFITAVQALNLPTGNVYLGGVTFSDLPFSGNAEVEVYIYPNNVVFLMLRSANVYPYLWTCNSHTYRGWESVGHQASTIPTATSNTLGQIVQYTGTTTSDYTNGYFYKCSEIEETTTGPLTSTIAQSGIDTFTIPESFSLDEPIYSGSGSYSYRVILNGTTPANYLAIEAHNTSGYDEIDVTAYYGGTEICGAIYVSSNRTDYVIEDVSDAGTFNIPETVALDSTWYDFAGFVTTEVTTTVPGWVQLDVVDMDDKQDTLVSGTNIKTINNNSLLGSGNLSIGESSLKVDAQTTTTDAVFTFEDKEPGIYLQIYCNVVKVNSNTHGYYLTSIATRNSGIPIYITKKYSDAAVGEKFAYIFFQTINPSQKYMSYAAYFQKTSDTPDASHNGFTVTYGHTKSDDQIEVVTTNGTQQYIGGQKIFTTRPRVNTLPTSSTEVSNKQYVDNRLAAEYDSSKTYNIGDYVYYVSGNTNSVFICKADSVTGAWDSTKWDAVSSPNILNKISKDINETIGSVLANPYDDTATYAVGDYVYHNSALYKCTTAITTAEAWNSSHWTTVSLDTLNILNNFNSEIGQINTQLSQI